MSEAAYVLSESEPEPNGSHDELMARYLRHVNASHVHPNGNLKAWHMLMAQGLYRLMADIECDGGPCAPMGLPHLLCVSASEIVSMVTTQKASV